MNLCGVSVTSEYRTCNRVILNAITNLMKNQYEYNLDEKPNLKTKRMKLNDLKICSFANSDNQLFFRINNIQVICFSFKMNNFMRFVVLFFLLNVTSVKFIKAQGNRLPGNDSSISNSSEDKAFHCYYRKPYWIPVSFYTLNEDAKYTMVSYLKKSNMNHLQYMKKLQDETLKLIRSCKKSFENSLAIGSNCFDQTQNFSITGLGKNSNKTTLKILTHITKFYFTELKVIEKMLNPYLFLECCFSQCNLAHDHIKSSSSIQNRCYIYAILPPK